MIRTAAFLAFLATPATAWEFTAGQPCILHYEDDRVAVELTYDPTAPLYTFALLREDGFNDAPVFALNFLGDMPIGISTTNHQLSADGKTLTVADSGFGNVLNGLQFNVTSFATLGDLRVKIPLLGAAAPVAAFRTCEASTPTS